MDTITKYYHKLRSTLSSLYTTHLSRFIRQLFTRPVEILFMGIDNAGKTTLVQKLKNDTAGTFNPTRHPVRNTLSIGNMRANVLDLGGHTAARLAWKDYMYECNGIVFLVDVKDSARYQTAAEAFESVRRMKGEGVPIAVLMNKVDLVGHTAESARNDVELGAMLKERIGVVEDDYTKVFYVSVVTARRSENRGNEVALMEAFEWLENKIYEKK